MADIDKVFDALRNCITEPKCRDCPWEDCERFECKRTNIPVSLGLDILELLKKQVPMEPKEMKVAKCHYQCAICGSYVGTKGLTVNRFNKKYCAECGQAVKWDD